MLEDFGWDDGWAASWLSMTGTRDAGTAARVVIAHGGLATLHDERLLPLAGALEGGPPVVGDWVQARDGAVRAVVPRRSVMRRAGETLVANVDLAIVVTSANRERSDRRAERLAAIAHGAGCRVLAVLAKADLAQDVAGEVAALRAATRAEAVALSALEGWGLDEIRARLAARRTGALLGSSGVGKSTLVNALLGEERQETRPIRERDDRGQHTTSRRELLVLPDGALLVDTPGVRLPRLDDDEGLPATFADVEELARTCRFRDCRHDGEPGCAVRDAVDPARLAALRKLEREALTAQERRAHQRTTQSRWTRERRSAGP